MEIEPLLARLEALAPSFGRAQHDIEAMVGRGRTGDYKGVMQNCRLVLEALLRALVADQLKQTPGKAMLDELITKFRQQANAGVIPTNVLAHMGTVQAWGNLSSHDHATKLSDDGVKVGKGEVMASLNSMVAILDWYAESFAKIPAKPPAQTVDLRPHLNPPRAQAKKPPLGLIAIGVVVLGGAGAAFLATRPAAVSAAAADPFVALDAVYAKWVEPVPPAPCRSPKEAPLLAGSPADLLALEALPQGRSAEAWYLIARAQFEQRKDALEAAKKAQACAGFAAALNLMGKIALREKRPDDALPNFQAALDAAPTFFNARYNLGMRLLTTPGRVMEGVAELKRLTAADPKFADAHYFLGMAYEGQGMGAEAKASFCAALANGREDARSRCER